ncbi:beta-lactamase-like protein [Firmicutes bacterium CAG:313]|nr:beta-lactamase-like protein [Firmicutes bacterium CAG:313]
MGRPKGSKNKKTIQKERVKTIKKLPTWLIIILVIAIIAFGVWYYFNVYVDKPNIDNPQDEIKNNVKDGTIYLGKEGTTSPELKVTFLDLYGNSNNQQIGDSIFIEYGDIDILIDAGEKASGSCTVVPFLLEHVEDKKLEMIITTHADSDHLGGMVGLSGKDMYGALEAPGIEYQYIVDFGYEADSKVYKDYVELRNARVQEGATYLSIKEIFNEENLEAAAHFYLGEDMFLDFLDYKTYGIADIDDDNDRSVSCLLTHDEKKILLCGDSEKKEESYLTKLNIGKVDVFKANHHGSPTSNTKNLLDQIRPEYVVICSSEENKYNLPKKTIISRLIEYTQNVYATFISGNIEVISKNNNITITSVKALIPVQNSTWYLTDDPNNPIK